jgi:hypothetical protein
MPKLSGLKPRLLIAHCTAVSLELLISTLALVFQVIVIFSWLAVLLSYFIYRAQTPPIDLELGTATTSRVS